MDNGVKEQLQEGNMTTAYKTNVLQSVASISRSKKGAPTNEPIRERYKISLLMIDVDYIHGSNSNVL